MSDAQRSRRVLAWVTIAGAAFVLLQAGVVRYARHDRSAQLADQLAEARAENRRAERRFRSRLEAGKREALGLKARLERSERSAAALREELAEASQTSFELRNHVEALSGTLDHRPPNLALRIEPTEAVDALLAVAENRGGEDVEILGAEGRLWLGPHARDAGATHNAVALVPGAANRFFEYRLLAQQPQLARTGALPVRGALCVVYRGGADDGREWVAEVWFEYRPELERVAQVEGGSWPLADGEIPCALEDTLPPW